jgi:hypothetical protein
VFDGIVKATQYYLSKHKRIDYDAIRKLSVYFIKEFGTKISYASTGVHKLKLKNIPLAKYLFHDRSDLREFI